MEFEKFKRTSERKEQSFDLEFEIEKAGKKYNLYQSIQDARPDTEIYPALEKYGCIDRLILDSQGVYTDLTQIKGLRNEIEKVEKAKVLWQQLPYEIKNHFNNNIAEFMDNGETWLKNKIAEESATTSSVAGVQPNDSNANMDKSSN